MDVRNGSNSRKLGSPRLATLDVVSSGDFQALRLRPSASPFGLDSHPTRHLFTVDELRGRPLATYVVDLQHPNPGAIVDRRERIQPAPRAGKTST